ncbi:MAG: choice-of-anchor Q domain-containing protein, partial [bacterium]
MGGGIECDYSTATTIANNLIFGNYARHDGGGICCWNSSPAIMNNTLFDNLSITEGGGIALYYNSSAFITNSILWNNHATNNPQIYIDSLSSADITYCNVQNGYTGEGNIDADPIFVNGPAGDFHLPYGSPCIDAGKNEGAPNDDFEDDPRPNGNNVDIGADEWRFVDEDGDEMGDYWEKHYFGDLSHTPGEDFDGDGHSNGDEYQEGADPTDAIHPSTYYVDDTTGDDSRSYLEASNPTTPWKTISRAVNEWFVGSGDTVIVAEGIYHENVNFNRKAITVKSTNPEVSSVVAATIIDGSGNDSVVTFDSWEGADSVLSGFTIQNG